MSIQQKKDPECQTYTQLVLAIAKEDERIAHMNAAYGHLRAELLALDAEIMHSYKKKWIMERRLLTVQKCKPAGPRASQKQQSAKMPSIKDLNEDQTIELLNFLTDLKKES